MNDPNRRARREDITPPGLSRASTPTTAWWDKAACQDAPTELFFAELGGSLTEARIFCSDCPVRTDCLTYAVERNEYGFWGGTTEIERRDIRMGRSKAVAA